MPRRVHTLAAGSVPLWSLQVGDKSFIDLHSHNLTMCILVDIYEDIVEYYVQVRIIIQQTKNINCAGAKKNENLATMTAYILDMDVFQHV